MRLFRFSRSDSEMYVARYTELGIYYITTAAVQAVGYQFIGRNTPNPFTVNGTHPTIKLPCRDHDAFIKHAHHAPPCTHGPPHTHHTHAHTRRRLAISICRRLRHARIV